jgi:beta-lactamase class A
LQNFLNPPGNKKRRTAPDRSRGAVALSPPPKPKSKSLSASGNFASPARKTASNNGAGGSDKASQPNLFAQILRTNRIFRYFEIAGLAVLLQGASLPVGTPAVVATQQVAMAPKVAQPPIVLGTSMDRLRDSLAGASNVPKLRTGVFVLDPRGGRYVDLDGQQPYAAASMIKLPVLVSLLAAIDRGDVKYTDQLTIRQDLITGGSGSLQWRPVNSKISLRDTAELMMVVSDNTATNMIIDVLGGKEKLNKEFSGWGLAQTKINNMLGDFEGTNKTSPYDLVCLLARIERNEILSPDSEKWLVDVMRHTRIRTLLNPGLGPGATIAHKTGDIGTMVGDVGIVFAPNGARYIVSIQVERPFNDRRGNALIRVLSRGIYNCFSTEGAPCKDTVVGSLQDEYRPVAASATGATATVHHHRRHRHH